MLTDTIITGTRVFLRERRTNTLCSNEIAFHSHWLAHSPMASAGAY